jgi:hypothetical protein
VAKERIRAKHAEAAQLRAQQAQRKRRKALVTRSVAILVLVGVAGSAGVCAIRNRQLTNAITTGTYTGGQHVAGTITYKESPPIGGIHNLVWQNCAIYDLPIHNEHAVHSLEHGAVWLTYRPGLSSGQVQQLKVLASDDNMLLSPYPGLTSPIVASSWNHQLSVDDAGDRRLKQFIAQFKNNPATTPEFGAPCAGGTSVTSEADSLKTAPGPMAR